MKPTRWIPVVALAAGFAAPALADDIQVTAGGSITAAMASAGFGDRVLVQEGTYFEHVALKDGVELRGGYDGTFSEGSRNPQSNVTIIHGSGTGPAITSGLSVLSATVDGFLLTGGGGTPGAGVLVIGGSPVFSNNDISGNRRAGAAGGAYVHSGSTARFESNTFRDNSSQGSGGGIRIESSPAVLVGNTFERCVAPHSGGAVYVVSSAVACTSNVYRDCVSGEGGGGGMYLQHATGVTLWGERFEDCRGPYGGGLFCRDDGAFTARELEFAGCHATAAGGGVAIMNFCTASFVDCRFVDCSSDGGGGGAWIRASTVDFFGMDPTTASPTTAFVDCTAQGAGGGVRYESSSGTVQGIRFSSCSTDSMGGGLYALHTGLTIRLTVFESCQAFDGGGLMLHTLLVSLNRNSFVLNNTFWSCAATGVDLGGGIQLWVQTDPANQFLSNATLRGNIVANTLSGGCIRCGEVIGEKSGTPSMLCTTVHKNSSNPSPEVPGAVSNGGCVPAYRASPTNRVADPLFCAPPSNLQLQICSPDVADNVCPQVEGKINRGAAPDGLECACGGLVGVEPSTWGKIKVQYR